MYCSQMKEEFSNVNNEIKKYTNLVELYLNHESILKKFVEKYNLNHNIECEDHDEFN